MQAVMRERWWAYWQLARMDKPIGTLLLLWPTLWSLWLAAAGMPPLWPLLAMVAGVFLMRAAGCVINDYADRHVDGHVKRTAHRPLPAGLLSERQALGFFASLCTMLVSAQPVTPSLGTVVAIGCLSAIRVLAWNGQEPEATTPRS